MPSCSVSYVRASIAAGSKLRHKLLFRRLGSTAIGETAPSDFFGPAFEMVYAHQMGPGKIGVISLDRLNA